MFKKTNISFLSENLTIAGSLYLPLSAPIEKLPGIILCQGFAGTKEMLLPAYAEKFAASGFATLTFDYRGFGGSGGEPGRLVPKLQIEDVKNAISYLSTLNEIDPNRIGLWGTSYGSANAIVAASEDQRIKCLSIQLAFGDGERCIGTNMTPEEKIRFKDTLIKLEEKKRLTGREMMVPISKILSDEQSKIFLQENIDKFPELKTKIPFLTILETMNYKPEQYLKNLHIPTLIIGAEKDIVNPISETYSLFTLASEPKELVVIKEATHFQLYAGKHFEQVVNKQMSWFSKYL